MVVVIGFIVVVIVVSFLSKISTNLSGIWRGLQEELIKEHGPESLADILSVKPGTSGSEMDPISIKLNDDNFSTWKAEALGKIKERNLEKFITMTDLGGRPPMFSEEYKSWKEQDQGLCRWLLSSLSTKLLHRLERCEYALELWMEIKVYFLDVSNILNPLENFEHNYN